MDAVTAACAGGRGARIRDSHHQGRDQRLGQQSPSVGRITVSPRNAQVAAGLASRFANVQVAPTNQAVLDACDVVVLAVRPQVASDVLSVLRFRADHHVVSVIATLPLEYIRSVTAPAM